MTLQEPQTYSIHNTTERLTWAGWLLLVFMISLFGDTAILIAATKYNAIKLNSILVTFILHIAACNLIISTISILPQCISLVANKWVFGTTICYIEVYGIYFFNLANMLLVCGITVWKLRMIHHPNRRWPGWYAHLVVAGIWTLSSTVLIMIFLIDKDDIYINPVTYSCGYAYTSDLWKTLIVPIVLLFSCLPTLVLFISSALLVKHLLYAQRNARRTNRRVRWQGMLTVLLTATVYCVSFLPQSLYITVKNFREELSRDCLDRAAETLTYVNVAANFFIYSLTVPSFKEFLLSRMRGARSFFAKKGWDTNFFISQNRFLGFLKLWF